MPLLRDVVDEQLAFNAQARAGHVLSQHQEQAYLHLARLFTTATDRQSRYDAIDTRLHALLDYLDILNHTPGYAPRYVGPDIPIDELLQFLETLKSFWQSVELTSFNKELPLAALCPVAPEEDLTPGQFAHRQHTRLSVLKVALHTVSRALPPLPVCAAA